MPGLHTLRARLRWLPSVVALCAGAGCHRSLSPELLPAPTANSVEIEVRTVDDTLARFARVSVALDGDSVPYVLVPKSPGIFHGELPLNATKATLTVTVAEHATFEAHAELPRERPARFIVRPRALIPRDSITNVRVLGDFNGFSTTTAVPMRPGPDGRLRADVPHGGAPSRFRILGIGGPDPGAWMPVHAYAISPDSSNGISFSGILSPVRDTLHFVVDTAALTRKDQRAPAIETMTADSGLSLVNSLVLERRDAQLRRLVLPEYRASDVDSTDWRAATRATVLARAASDPRVRTAAYVSRFTLLDLLDMGAPRPVDMAREFLALLTPDNPLLRDKDGMQAANLAIFFSDTSHGADAADSARIVDRRLALQRAYVLPVARDASVPNTVRASAYISVIFGHQGVTNQDTLDALIDEAVAALPNNRYIVRLTTTLGRLRTLRVGAPFPTFSMRALGDSLSAPITNESFRGKVTLIDFWGMWCAPCVAEMPVLHDAFAKYASRGFTILSIDTDSDIAQVAVFRKSRWPMPWLHGWVRGGPESQALRALGVAAFPTAVLVGADGRILAVNAGLRGAALGTTLARVLP